LLIKKGEKMEFTVTYIDNQKFDDCSILSSPNVDRVLKANDVVEAVESFIEQYEKKSCDGLTYYLWSDDGAIGRVRGGEYEAYNIFF